MTHHSKLVALARAFLAGEQDVESIAARCDALLQRPSRWIRPVARRYLEATSGHLRPRESELASFLQNDPEIRKRLTRLHIAHWLVEPQWMQPVEAARDWSIPAIETTGDLADWLGLYPSELAWFADLKALGYKQPQPKLHHYYYRVLAKRSGGFRVIEAPKSRLKEMQRQILRRILAPIPPHDAVHGFRRGRSIRTFAAPHAGRRVVLRMDLRDFFPTFTGARVQAFFRTAGYPESVAGHLGGICTNAAPGAIWHNVAIPHNEIAELEWLYQRPHLPQGAPTSPDIANLCAYRLDCRLAGLAASANATYTRYADDLAFSGDSDFDRRAERFALHAAAIANEEGFAVHVRKTRIMRQGVRQYLAGLVTNHHVNIDRRDFDRLKATLTNCVRTGPASQNRGDHAAFRQHLEGRVAFIDSINPAKGARLRSILEKIDWR